MSELRIALSRQMGAVCAALALLATPSHAAPLESDPAFQWTNLRKPGPAAQRFLRLWKDRLVDNDFVALQAATLHRTFNVPQGKVLVSFLIDMLECEMPGNSAGGELIARCPMRIVSTSTGGARRVSTHEKVCLMLVFGKPGDTGPDPRTNFMNMHLDADRTLHIAVVESGKRVPSCERHILVEP